MGAAAYFLKNKDGGSLKLTSYVCLSDTFA